MKKITTQLLALLGLAIIAGVLPMPAEAQKSLYKSGNFSITGGDEKNATVKKDLKIGNFSKIEAANGIQIVFREQSATGIAKIRTTPSAEKYLYVNVGNGVFEAGYKIPSSQKQKQITIEGPTIIELTAPQLQSVELSSGAILTADKIANSNKLELELSSGAMARVNTLGGKLVELEASSGAKIEVIKKIDSENVVAEASSGASISCGNVSAVKFKVESSSGAVITASGVVGTTIVAEASSAANLALSGISVKGIKAEATSGAGVKLSGSCETLSQDVQSGGSMNTYNLRVTNDSAKTVTLENGEVTTPGGKNASKSASKSKSSAKSKSSSRTKNEGYVRTQTP